MITFANPGVQASKEIINSLGELNQRVSGFRMRSVDLGDWPNHDWGTECRVNDPHSIFAKMVFRVRISEEESIRAFNEGRFAAPHEQLIEARDSDAFGLGGLKSTVKYLTARDCQIPGGKTYEVLRGSAAIAADTILATLLVGTAELKGWLTDQPKNDALIRVLVRPDVVDFRYVMPEEGDDATTLSRVLFIIRV